jgi:Flp pilus assembly protein TadG
MKNDQIERASITTESLVLAPVIMMIFLFVVYVGKLSEASFRVTRAADVAARVASQLQGTTALQSGEGAARTDLLLSRSPCRNVMIHLTRGRQGRLATVSAMVSCTVRKSGFSLLSVPNRRVTATSTEVIDFYTGRP